MTRGLGNGDTPRDVERAIERVERAGFDGAALPDLLLLDLRWEHGAVSLTEQERAQLDAALARRGVVVDADPTTSPADGRGAQ